LQDILNSVQTQTLKKTNPNTYLHGRPVGEHRLTEADMDYGSQIERRQ